MDTSRRTYGALLTALCLLSCSRPVPEERETALLCLEAVPTRSADPDEYRISDCQLWIFHPEGLLEEKRYLSARERAGQTGGVQWQTRLLRNQPYRVYACANLGYELPFRTEAELRAFRYYLAYPDEYSQGMPMAAQCEELVLSENGQRFPLLLERLMARVDLSIDRTGLDPDVQVSFREVIVGGCPSSVLPFSPSRAESNEQLFASGFFKDGSAADALNREVSVGHSRTLRLYLLENRQETGSESVSSYIELRAEYRSPDKETQPGSYLLYRFHFGEEHSVRRNCIYPVTVRLEGDGLGGDGWAVDTSALTERIRFELHPAAFNTCSSGDSFHIWCDISPSRTPVEIEPLAYNEDPDVAALYRYELDPDGHGLTIHTWKGGTAMVYIKAGHPVDRDTLAMLVIDP